jgi:hypothetical protein
MTFNKPDGVIEIGHSGCCCPPGERRDGMHTNCATSWWRVGASAWHRFDMGSHHVRILAEAAESAREFEAEMLKT